MKEPKFNDLNSHIERMAISGTVGNRLEWGQFLESVNIATNEGCGIVDYIDRHFKGRQIDFATAQGVRPQQVTQWITKGFIVVDHQLYSPRRAINKED